MSENITKESECAIQSVEKGGVNYVEDNNVYILGEFDNSISKNIMPNMLKIINSQSNLKNGKIDFYINSNGGYTHELYGLLSMIALAKSNGIKIRTFNLGRAYSAGSYLAVVGDERKMYKYAFNLLHLGTTWESNSTIKQLDRNHTRQKEHFNNLIRIYKEHTKLTERQIKEMMADDCCFLNAKKCLKYGIVDEII